MAERIETPPTLQGDEKKQLQQVWSYLYQLAESINNNLQGIGSNELTDSERVILKDIIGAGEEQGLSEMETLKSLIIKTADFVQTSLTEYRMNLLGETVASGQFGRYVRHTGLDVAVTPTGITQNYSFEEVVQGLKEYSINAKNYIKTGLLRTVSSIPVYGVAIGKDVVTFSQDGTETYNDGNKVAELTADELSFWQNGVKVASYKGTELVFYTNNTARLKIDSNGVTILNGSTKIAELLNTALKFYYNGTLRAQYDSDGVGLYNGSTLLAKYTNNRIGFYYGGTEVFYISNGKIYAANDLEISTGKTFKISSGGVIDVDTNNFKIDSANRILKADGWELTDDGIYYKGVFLSKDVQVHLYNTDESAVLAFKYDNHRGAISVSYDTWKYHVPLPGHSESGKIHADIGELTEVWADDIDYYTLHQQSSKDIKHDIQDLPEMGEKLDRLRPVTFVYDEDAKEQQRMGLIYEETVDVMPEICTGNEAHKAINYVEMIPALLKEIQGLRARVKALEEREGGN